MKRSYVVKVFPSIGPAFLMEIPEDVEDVDAFMDDHLINVEFWEWEYDYEWTTRKERARKEIAE